MILIFPTLIIDELKFLPKTLYSAYSIDHFILIFFKAASQQ